MIHKFKFQPGDLVVGSLRDTPSPVRARIISCSIDPVELEPLYTLFWLGGNNKPQIEEYDAEAIDAFYEKVVRA